VSTTNPADRSVTFSVKDLSDNDSPLVVKKVPHECGGPRTAACSFAIGGRDAGAAADAAPEGGWDASELNDASGDETYSFALESPSCACRASGAPRSGGAGAYAALSLGAALAALARRRRRGAP
jgi:MYXO-CTERM domain-containing protein